MHFVASCLQVAFLIPKDLFYLRSGLINSYYTVPQADIHLKGPEILFRIIRSFC